MSVFSLLFFSLVGCLGRPLHRAQAVCGLVSARQCVNDTGLAVLGRLQLAFVFSVSFPVLVAWCCSLHLSHFEIVSVETAHSRPVWAPYFCTERWFLPVFSGHIAALAAVGQPLGKHYASIIYCIWYGNGIFPAG